MTSGPSLSPPLRLGLVGYGAGGRFFHAPFIVAADGVELAGVVTRSPAPARRAGRGPSGRPGLRLDVRPPRRGCRHRHHHHATPDPEGAGSRSGRRRRARHRGQAVRADRGQRPGAGGRRGGASVALNVFHNRRWDADIRTLAALFARGDLGELWRVESRFDADDPATLEPGPQGGLLRDIGSHLVDQVLWLLGPAETVYAELEWVDLPEGRTDCGFSVSIRHASGSIRA